LRSTCASSYVMEVHIFERRMGGVLLQLPNQERTMIDVTNRVKSDDRAH